MFRYPLPLREGSQVQALFPSSGTDLLPSPSPDGQWIAFHSDRSREARLWVGEPANPVHLRMIEGITPISRNPPPWSADRRKLLVVVEGTEADRSVERRVGIGGVSSCRSRWSPYHK